MRYRRIWLPVSLLLGFLLSSCSPFYIVQAGWEEAGILWNRESIEKLIAKESTEPELKRKLGLVLDARKFAEEIGLKPEESFTKYSEIDREVLLWVLSGSSKVALRPVTWWFPIVGSIPYKGFFDKEDADSELSKLLKKDYDGYLRPSAAFSTLGWFNDPLLSTTVRFDDVSLVNTVIHEILHNTVWIKNHAPFNETLANFVGTVGALEFYNRREGAESPSAKQAAIRWQNEIQFGKFLDDLITKLNVIYVPDGEPLPEPEAARYQEIVAKREVIFKTSLDSWKAAKGIPPEREITFNNAVIIANKIYLDRPWLFEELFELSGKSVVSFIAEIKVFAEKTKDDKSDPYVSLEAYLAEKRKESLAQIATPRQIPYSTKTENELL